MEEPPGVLLYFEAGETVGQNSERTCAGFYGISRIKLKSGVESDTCVELMRMCADVERVGGEMRGKCSALTTEWVSE